MSIIKIKLSLIAEIHDGYNISLAQSLMFITIYIFISMIKIIKFVSLAQPLQNTT